jgi:MarR family 2-MHQ and catechol resistance regulon transcriptional repressor
MNVKARSQELAGYLRVIRQKLQRVDKWNPKISQVLNVQEVHALLTIGAGGAMTMSAIADRLQLSLSSMTSVIDKLEKKKFVARGRKKDDRRVVEVTLTDAGLKFYDIVQDSHLEFVTQLLKALDTTEQDTLLNLFRKITANLK